MWPCTSGQLHLADPPIHAWQPLSISAVQQYQRSFDVSLGRSSSCIKAATLCACREISNLDFNVTDNDIKVGILAVNSIWLLLAMTVIIYVLTP